MCEVYYRKQEIQFIEFIDYRVPTTLSQDGGVSGWSIENLGDQRNQDGRFGIVYSRRNKRIIPGKIISVLKPPWMIHFPWMLRKVEVDGDPQQCGSDHDELPLAFRRSDELSVIQSEGCMQAGNDNRSPVENAVANGFRTASACSPENNSEEIKDKASGVPCLFEVEEASGTTSTDDERQDVQYGLQEQKAFSNCQRQSEETLVREVACSVSPNMVQMVQSVTTMETDCSNLHVKPGSAKTEKVSHDVTPADGRPGSSSPKIETADQPRHSIVASSDIPSSNPSTSSSSADFPSASSLSSFPSTTGSVISKNPICNQISKEFKLNPGAKIFSPSSMNLRTSTPTVSNVDQVSDISTLPIVDAHSGIQFNHPTPHAGLPVKYAPHSNLAAGNGGNHPQNPQPVFGHINSRSQPIRYIVQYMPPQGGSMYVHPSNQTVMVGRMGPVVYAPSVSQDSVHGASAIPQGLVRPLLSVHQPLLPKHHGAAPQPVQLCMAPPFAPVIHQPLVLPNHLPISQPFPTVRPVPVASGTGILGNKFAM